MPKSIIGDDLNDDQFEVAVYTTVNLYTHNGRTPENQFVKYLTDSLDDIGVDYRVYYDFLNVPIPNENMQCPQSSDSTTAHEEWEDYLNSTAQFVAADANLLLTDAGGGGCGGGNVGVMGAGDIDEQRDALVGTGGWAGSMYGALHEVGHMMGWGHDPHPGRAWVDASGDWNKTPSVGTREAVENLCNEQQDADPEPGVPDNLHLYYHDCVAEHIETEGARPFTVSNLDADTDVAVGDDVLVQVQVSNRTPVRIFPDLVVAVDGTEIDTLDYDIQGRQVETLSTTWTPTSPGTHTIQAGGSSISRTVGSDGEVRVTEVSAEPAEPEVGDDVDIDVTAENTTSQIENRDWNVIVSEGSNRPQEDVGEVMYSLSPGEEETKDVSWNPDEAGGYDILVGDYTLPIEVSEADDPGDGEADIRIESLSISNSPVRVDKTAIVSVEAENRGDGAGTRTTTIRADGEFVGTVTFDLSPGSSGFKTAEWTPDEAGSTVLTAGSAVAVVDVDGGSGGDPPDDPPVDPGDPLPGIGLAAGVAGIGMLLAAPEGRADQLRSRVRGLLRR